MPRPENLDPELLAEWEALTDDFFQNPPSDAGYIRFLDERGRQVFRDVMLSGYWLEHQLQQIGATEQETRRCCEAHGQRCFGKPDPWAVAQQQLEKYQQGNPDKPGERLAEEITAEVFGGEMEQYIRNRQRRRAELHRKFTTFVD